MTTATQPDPRVFDLARRQHWAITTSQLLATGLTPAAIRHGVAAGRLHPVHRGVFAVGRPDLTREGRWMAAVLSAGPGAGLAQVSAVLNWAIDDRAEGLPHVVVPASGGRRRRPGVVVHRSRTLTADDIVVRDGIPVTTLPRTLWDLAGLPPSRARLRPAVRQAVRLHGLDIARLLSELDGRPDARSARLLRVLALWVPRTEVTESELEARFLALCARARIPAPDLQRRFGNRRADFVWHDCRLIVETDGASHLGLVALGEDRAKDRDLQMRGYAVIRFTWADVVNRPAQTAREIRAHRARRFRELTP
jgi:very-short-patch-repair endonuclease